MLKYRLFPEDVLMVPFVQSPQQFFADGRVEIGVVEQNGLDGK